MSRQRWLQFASIGVTLFVAVITLHRVFSDWLFLVPFGGAIALPLLVSGLARSRDVKLWLSVSLSFVVLCFYLFYAVLVNSLVFGLIPGPTALRSVGSGWTKGFQETLDTLLPLEDETGPRVFLTTVVWMATLAAAEIIARTRRTVLPVLPVLVIFVTSLALGATRPELHWWLISTLIAASLVFILIRTDPQHAARAPGVDVTEFHTPTLLRGRLVAGLPIVALVAIAGPFLSAGLAFGRSDDPFDPRELRDEQFAINETLNPLSEFKSIRLQQPAVDALTVAFTDENDALTVDRLGLVSLDAFDGAEWSSTSSYARVRGRLPSDDSVSGRVVSATIAVGDTVGPWLPTLGRPTEISLGGALFDSVTGDLIVDSDPRGRSYRVTGEVTDLTDAERADAVPASGSATTPFTVLDPAPPADIVERTAAITSDGETPVEQLDLLAENLLNNYVFDESAPPGHSYGDIQAFLAGKRGGYSEQFAGAFAIMARTLGFPSRLVLGYRTVEEVDGQLVPLSKITSDQYFVWPEIRTTDGWLAFDPTPAKGDTPPDLSPEIAGPATTIAPAPSTDAQGKATPREQGPTVDTPAEDSAGFSSVLIFLAIAAGLVCAALAIAAIVIIVGKRRRRAARAQAELPTDRIIGAWSEARARLREAGVALPDEMTNHEIYDACRRRFGSSTAQPLASMAPDVDAAVFGEIPPEEWVARQAWIWLEQFETSLQPHLTRPDRIRGKLDPRTLLDA